MWLSFRSICRNLRARVEDGQLRRAVVVNRQDELGEDELEDGAGSRPHAELWLDFVEGMGGVRARADVPVKEISELTGWFHSVASEGAPEEALAAFYAYESQVPRVASEKAKGLRESVRRGREDLRVLHAAHDGRCLSFADLEASAGEDCGGESGGGREGAECGRERGEGAVEGAGRD